MKKIIKTGIAICMALSMALIGVLLTSTKAEAASKTEAISLAVSAKGSETTIDLDNWYQTSLPRSSESFYYFSLEKKTKVRLEAVYDAGYFEILDQNYRLIYAGTSDEKMNAPQDWTLTKDITLSNGTYYLHLYTKDQYAGDEMKFILSDRTAPVKPKVTKVTKYKVIKGKTTAGSTVYVKCQNKIYQKMANAKGIFTIKTKKMKKGTSITVWAKSKNGIKSKVTKYKVK